jgi:hypothetical protein
MACLLRLRPGSRWVDCEQGVVEGGATQIESQRFAALARRNSGPSDLSIFGEFLDPLHLNRYQKSLHGGSNMIP